MSTRPTSLSEIKAMSVMAKARNNNLGNLFEGTELVFSRFAKEKAAKDILSDGKKVAKASHKLGKAIADGTQSATDPSQVTNVVSQTHELIGMATGGMDLSTVQEILTSDVTHQLVGELTPFVGILTSGYKSVKSWRAVIKNAYDVYKGDYYMEGVLPGDPTAAADAVMVCIKRMLAAHSVDAVRNSTSLGMKIGGLFADFGTATTAAVGAATVAAKLIQDLIILGRDYADMKAGNKHLESADTLNLLAFKDCPILGCYLISCSDTSMIVNMMMSDMGSPNWMTKVEQMKKTQLDPLIKNSTKAITSSHLTLSGLKSNKGIYKTPGFMDRQVANAKHQFNELIVSNAKNLMNS